MNKVLIGLLLVLVTGILLGYGVSWYLQQDQGGTDEVRIAITREVSMREVQLSFTAAEGTFLVSEPRDIPMCEVSSDCINSLLTGLINGSKQGSFPVLPKETKILSIDVENDLVRVDFSRQLVDFHPGGSLAELLSIYSIANSLSESFPYIRQIQILVEGEVKQTLKGHVRIDQPIYADFSYNDPPLTVTLPGSTEEKADTQGLSIEALIENSESSGDN
ncbi:MAG: GerMN domain-containing protein [Desulfuromusa sp.]|nr:GerMN domain-containing protein [Desulfuromusa sp.]